MTRHVLQRLLLGSSPATAALYGRLWREGTMRPNGDGAGADIAPGEVLDLDTYFNCFDETVWRRHTRVGTLTLELHLAGPCRVRLIRRTRDRDDLLLADRRSDGDAPLRLEIPALPHQRATGRLSVRIEALEQKARLRSGAWCGDGEASAIRLMPVICTHQREVAVRDLLTRIGADDDVLHAIAGVVVVDNGGPGAAARLGTSTLPPRLRNLLILVEQENVGGAGGFSRGLLAALDAGATHAILMDDDVALEPDAILRTARFYALASSDLVIAGHMLDLFKPNRLYEAGARILDRNLATQPINLGLDLATPDALDHFADPTAMHYNGWWFMGLPLALLDRHGWPMPCFLRGDDVEFGIVGVGIWHEPFYAKLGSWHIYYEVRNMLVLAAVHLPRPIRPIVLTTVKWVLAELLLLRYQRAAYILRAAEDFLAGPSVFTRPPLDTHRSLAPIAARDPIETMTRETVMPHPMRLPRGPRSRAAFAFILAFFLLREWFRPNDTGRVMRISPRDHLWFRVGRADLVVVDEPFEREQPVYKRDRARFRALLRQLISLVWRFRRELPATLRTWRTAHGVFTTEPAWRDYLQAPGPVTAEQVKLDAD